MPFFLQFIKGRDATDFLGGQRHAPFPHAPDQDGHRSLGRLNHHAQQGDDLEGVDAGGQGRARRHRRHRRRERGCRGLALGLLAVARLRGGRQIKGPPALVNHRQAALARQPVQQRGHRRAQPGRQLRDRAAGRGAFDQDDQGLEQVPVPGKTNLPVKPQAIGIEGHRFGQGVVSGVGVEAVVIAGLLERAHHGHVAAAPALTQRPHGGDAPPAQFAHDGGFAGGQGKVHVVNVYPY